MCEEMVGGPRKGPVYIRVWDSSCVVRELKLSRHGEWVIMWVRRRGAGGRSCNKVDAHHIELCFASSGTVSRWDSLILQQHTSINDSVQAQAVACSCELRYV